MTLSLCLLGLRSGHTPCPHLQCQVWAMLRSPPLHEAGLELCQAPILPPSPAPTGPSQLPFPYGARLGLNCPLLPSMWLDEAWLCLPWALDPASRWTGHRPSAPPAKNVHYHWYRIFRQIGFYPHFKPSCSRTDWCSAAISVHKSSLSAVQHLKREKETIYIFFEHQFWRTALLMFWLRKRNLMIYDILWNFTAYIHFSLIYGLFLI